MPTEAEYIYWHKCWPEAILNTLRGFMESGDSSGVLGISSLAVCYVKPIDYETAVSVLIREVLQGLDEAKEIREKLRDRRLEFKEMGLYDIMEKRAALLERGLVPLPRVNNRVTGYRREAHEIYRKLNRVGLLRIESHSLRPSDRPTDWIGLNGKWDGLVEGIRTSETTPDMFASSLGIILYLAIEEKGFTTVFPMIKAVIAAEESGGEIPFEDLQMKYYNRKPRDLDRILERQREKTEPLKIFPSDDGRRLIVNRNTAYAIKICQAAANRLFRGVTL